jgi:hypothetical protein
MDGLIALGSVVAGTGLLWGEAVLFGRPKLRRFVEARGYTIARARWIPIIWSRRAAFNVTLERGGQVIQCRALVGGAWWGPLLSSRVSFDLDDGLPSP